MDVGTNMNDIVDWNDFVGQVYDENDVPNEEFASLIKERDEKIYME